MIIGSRSLHPRKLQMPLEHSQKRLTEAVHVEDRNPAALLQSLLEQMTKRRCNADAAELLLTTMSTHFADLEANHRELVSVLMARIYLEVVTTEDPLVRLNLLQLVETRARLWRQDSAADMFYKNRKLIFDRQNSESTPQPKAAPVTVVPADQMKSKPIKDKMHEQRLVVSDKVEIRLFSNCEASLQESFGVLQNYYRKKQMQQFDSISTTKTASTMHATERNLFDPAKLVPNVETSTSSFFTTNASSGREEKPLHAINVKPIAKEVVLNGMGIAEISETKPVKYTPPEEAAVDHIGANNRIKEHEFANPPPVFKQPVERRRVIIQDFKTANQEPRGSGRLGVDGPSQSKFSRDVVESPNRLCTFDSTSTNSKDTIDVHASSSKVDPVIDQQDVDPTGHCSSNESGAGDCMKLEDKREAPGWARWQSGMVDLAPDVGLCDDVNEDASCLDSRKVLRYQRDFLVGCGTRASAKHLPRIWPELCTKFKGVCLLPKEGPQVQLYVSVPDQWTIFRPQQ